MTGRARNRGIRVQALRNRAKGLIVFLGRPVLAASLLAAGDSLGLFLALGSIPESTLILILFLEGGFGLILGVGIALSATPSAAKLGETLLGTAPWSRDSEKNAERVGRKWLMASSFLILIGFSLSIA